MHRWLILAGTVALGLGTAGSGVAAPALKEVERSDEPAGVLPAQVESVKFSHFCG